MKLSGRLFVLFLGVFTLFVSGCGSGPSSSPASISNNTWYNMSVSVPMDSTNPRSCKMDVDVFPDPCSDGQYLVDHTTSVSIALTRVDPYTDPGPLFLEKYTVDYIPSVPGSPIIPEMTVYQTLQLAEGGNTFQAVVMDVGRKQDFATLFATDQYPQSILPVSYTAVFTFYGQNSYGQPWVFQAYAPIYVGEYNECVACS